MPYNLTLPEIDKSKLSDEQYVKRLGDYLYMLSEQLRYSFLTVEDEAEENGNQIKQLRGKTMRIDKSVDGLRAELSDLETGTSEKFEMTNGQIVLKVDASGRVVQAELTSDPKNGSRFAVGADNIDLDGYVSLNGKFMISPNGDLIINSNQFKLDLDGNAEFKGKMSGGSIQIGSETKQFSVSENGTFGAIDRIVGSNITYRCGFGIVTGLSTRGFEVTENFDGVISKSYMTPYEVLTRAVNGLAETSNGNPYLNGKAVGTTAWVLENFARVTHSHSTSQTAWTDNGNTNASFAGGVAASTNWVLNNFQRASSDERLKDIIGDVSDIAGLYMAFEPMEWKPKEKTNYRKKIHTTVSAQGVMQAFEQNGLDWRNYDIIEEKDIMDTDLCGLIADYTDDENYYVVNTDNLHAYHVAFAQQMYRDLENKEKQISELESRLERLEKILKEKGVI